jgi:hypothetical protein
MKKFACHYAIARFLPYLDGGEFVNIGVIICCPETGLLVHKMEEKRQKRVTDFFPELSKNFYRDGLRTWAEELQRISYAARKETVGAYFAEATKAKGAAFRFGPTAAVLTANPHQELERLFDRYVLRQYEATKEQPELKLQREISGVLRQHQLKKFYNKRNIGGDGLPTDLPFVYWPKEVARPIKAMKPLHLDKTTPIEIYDHAGFWLQRISWLRDKNLWPEETLFAMKPPVRTGKHLEAYREVTSKFTDLGIEVQPITQMQAILQFAQEGVREQLLLKCA